MDKTATACGLRPQVIIGKCNRITYVAGYKVQLSLSNVVSYTSQSVVSGTALNVKEILHSLDKSEIQSDFSLLSSLLKESSRQKNLYDGRRIHSHIIRSSLDRKLLLSNLLIKLYGGCGDPIDAQIVFDRMQTRNVITWTLIIDAYIQCDDYKRAIQVYQEMIMAGIKPNNITLVTILTATSLHQGMLIHFSVAEHGFDNDVILGTALINMYRKFGCINSAKSVFDKMGSRDVVAWNTLMAAYVYHGKHYESIELYLDMLNKGVEPNHVSYVTLLGVCNCPSSILQGLSLHASITESGFTSHTAASSALVTMYSKCKSIDDAHSVFANARPRSTVMWNAMLTAYMDNGQEYEALTVYEEMKYDSVKPNHVTFITALGAAASLGLLLHGMNMYATVVSHSLESQMLVSTALFNMYGKCGDTGTARWLFDRLTSRDLVTWNAMLSVYVLNGHAKEAFQFYDQMQKSQMVPDKFTFNTLLSLCSTPLSLVQGHCLHHCIIIFGLEGHAGVGSGLVGMYNKCGMVEAAHNVFDKQYRNDLTVWNTMLTGYIEHNFPSNALELYRKLWENNIKPDAFTFSAVLAACSCLAASEQGKEIHSALVEAGFDSECAVGNALVHMYSKCGNMGDALLVFDKKHKQDVISWNALISGYAEHGHSNEALNVFRKMEMQITANDITFVGIFTACVHGGLVEDVLELFGSMQKAHGIAPGLEHYSCVVDLFGRVGRIEEAETFMNLIPIQPDVVLWKVLLGSCKIHNCMDEGRFAAEHAVELDSENTLSYVLLSNIYATIEDV